MIRNNAEKRNRNYRFIDFAGQMTSVFAVLLDVQQSNEQLDGATLSKQRTVNTWVVGIGLVLLQSTYNYRRQHHGHHTSSLVM